MATSRPMQGAKQVKQEARRVANAPWVEPLTRVGYIARGVIYLIIGVLAVSLATRQGGKVTDQTGAIAMLSGAPLGKFVLLLLGIGLLGYALWGFIRALLDPYRRGSDSKGILARVGHFFSGVTYGTLALVSFYYGFGWGVNKAGNPQDLTLQLIKLPFGQWLTVALGLIWIAVGLSQWYVAYKAQFEQELNPPAAERDVSRWLGQFGYAARGVVFVLSGWFIVQAGLTFDPSKAKGIDGALLALTNQPYGMWALLLVGLGLVAFGLFSVLSSRWVRLPKA